MHAEFWPVAEALAQHFSLLFGLEVRSESLKEKLAGLGHEEVRAAVPALRMKGRSPFDLTGHILVVGRECVTEL